MRHFIYQDEKSHKFWAVEQQGNELHISWGKVGTNGQNQVKSFADAAAAEKAELKLIAEKVKKGYVEQAKDNSLQPSQTVTDSLKVADLSTIIQEQPSFVAETRAADKNTDAVLPWLAKDIAVVFPPKVVHTTLSHRRFPGVPVQQADKLTQLRRLACSVSQRDNKTATFDFSACSLEWQNTVAQAISQIDGLKTTQLPSPVMAVLTALEMKCTRYKEREDVMDQIIQEGGLEYATDVIIHLQQISIEWDYVNNNIVFLSSGISPDYLQQYSSFELRLRKHLSLAERMEQKSGRVVLQELGFGDDVWLFLNYILPGKLDAARNSLIVQWHYYPGRVEEIMNGWSSPEAQLAEQALRNGHVEVLINIWENDSYSRYRREKSIWNLYLLAQLPREMALTFWLRINEKKHLSAGEDYFLSIFGLDALPGLLLAFSHRPKETFPLILNFGATELALPVARVWRRFAAQRDLARQWILHWPEHTATALIPLVFTKSSDNSEAALLALRLLYEQGHGELLQTVANRWQRTDVWPALEQLLKQSPIEIYPTRIPKAPDFWQPAMWSRPRLITNNQPVTDDALEIIGEMLCFTQGGRFYSGLEQLKTFCQPQTLAAFAWDLFTAWQQAGAPAKDNWAFLALSLFGDESTARDLTTQILAWPQEGKSARAVSGLNILTKMNNDMALIQLHHISQRAKSRPLRDNAAEFLQVVAENRGLSQEELADRLVPTLGLDDPQALIFDFGPRQFTVRFDENLNPVIFDQQNVRQKSVPRLRADDDQLKTPEALARLKGLKKDATQVSKNLLPRLETALRTTRRWSLADFHSLFVNHPFTRLVTQRLIWGFIRQMNRVVYLTPFVWPLRGSSAMSKMSQLTCLPML